uniref:Uncharacterized protein n=1 Tax=uncultured bacterium contig00002 TaxID=1181494 RepID=A0A806KFX0_9BACT|nr:hypothetical protein [uncultured bacterium contig00002]
MTACPQAPTPSSNPEPKDQIIGKWVLDSDSTFVSHVTNDDLLGSVDGGSTFMSFKAGVASDSGVATINITNTAINIMVTGSGGNVLSNGPHELAYTISGGGNKATLSGGTGQLAPFNGAYTKAP